MDISRLVYSYYVKKDLERDLERKDEGVRKRHYPSSLCMESKDRFLGKCRRAIYWDMVKQGKTNPIEGPALFKMDLGNFTHEKMGAIVDAQIGDRNDVVVDGPPGYGEEIEVKWEMVDLKYPFSGRLDKRFSLDGKDYGCEWKGTYGRGATMIQKNGPREDAFLQVTAYLLQPVFPVDVYILSYIAMDSGFIYSFQFELNLEGNILITWLNSGSQTIVPNPWDDVISTLAELEICVETNTLPKRDYSATFKGDQIDRKSDWRCRYCGYTKVCWGI